MSNGIFIDTQKVKDSATKIGKVNAELTSNFKTNVEKKMKVLQSNWNGQTADIIIRHFYNMQNELVSARETELQNYVTILKQAVGEGYEQTENANTQLADLFK